jgi:anti-sigma regulatory factor (Ser/Thr protein kinase)
MKREMWLPAVPASVRAARSVVGQAATEAGLDDGRSWDLMLATSEAVANAVQHGAALPNDRILLTTTRCARGLRVEVCNRGTFNGAPKPAALKATSGRGIQIIAAVVDRLEVKNGNDLTVVRFEKDAAPG